MSARSSNPVPVSFSEVLDAFLFASSGPPSENQAYICLTTGKTYFVSSFGDTDEDVPDDVETSHDYVVVPHKNDLDLGRDLVFSFVDAELPDQSDTVADIFRRKGAYGRFKDLLETHDMLDKWYAFEESATERALRAWCQESGIQLTDT